VGYADVQDNSSAAETWDMRSRWLPGGSGRSDAEIHGGDLGAEQITASECWDDLFKRTYWTIDPVYPFLDPPEGSAEACVFDTAEVGS